MPRNLELKLKVSSLDRVRQRISVLTEQRALEIEQEDTFFDVPDQRIKLRITSPGQAELITYQRADIPGPRLSHYTRQPQVDPVATQNKLSQQFKIRGVIKKRRSVYFLKQARIHLDVVAGLGTFVELEVDLTEKRTQKDGMAIIQELVHRLSLQDAQPVAEAYIDLVTRPQKRFFPRCYEYRIFKNI